ncbi:MAG TPA: hypothetical protein DCG30_02340 [Ruminococcus sp.]|nr:hypothetical protein [Ruminococcus sp.]
MRKIIAFSALMIVCSMFSGCSVVKSTGFTGVVPQETTEAVSSVVTQPQTQTQQIVTDVPVTTAAETDDIQEVTTVTAEKELADPNIFSTPDKVPVPNMEGDNHEDYENIEVDNNGAVVVNNDMLSLSDDELKAAAQTLYESACKTEWSYTVGSPYAINYDESIENELGWKYYMIITDGINSIADVEKDYYKVFSHKYPNALAETFMESGGHVYALNGSRGTNIFYINSKITSIDSKGDDEIMFTVTSYYDGSPYDDSGSYEDAAEFSMVRDDDGTWKAGKFRLPY